MEVNFVVKLIRTFDVIRECLELKEEVEKEIERVEEIEKEFYLDILNLVRYEFKWIKKMRLVFNLISIIKNELSIELISDAFTWFVLPSSPNMSFDQLIQYDLNQLPPIPTP